MAGKECGDDLRWEAERNRTSDRRSLEVGVAGVAGNAWIVMHSGIFRTDFTYI